VNEKIMNNEELNSEQDLPEDVENANGDETETVPFEDAAEQAEEVSPLIVLQNQVEDLEDKLVRSHAELANFRRRAAVELQQFRMYEGINLLRDLLPVIDNLQRAAQAAENASSIDDLKKGVEMVTQQFVETLGKHNVEPIHAGNEAFDPNQHEAIQQIPSADVPAMHVLQELETGYKIHDRIIRPAKVIVSTGPAE
tara:strand:- start:604 stop:1194 length:591 start_codon:yes stop_codon:yes gene_type:complete